MHEVQVFQSRGGVVQNEFPAVNCAFDDEIRL